MISILISSESRYPISRPKIKERIRQIIKKIGLEDVEVSVSFVGDRKIKDLNRKFRQVDETTDVLSFPLEEARGPNGILRLGDIVISYPQARKWASLRNKFVDEVILELVEHGLWHLLGYKHDNNTGFKIPTTKIFSTGFVNRSRESGKDF